MPLFVACVMTGNVTSASAAEGLVARFKQAQRQCNLLIVRKAYNEAAASCEAEAVGFERFSHDRQVTYETSGSLLIASAFSYGVQSYALAHVGNIIKSKSAFTMGQATLRAVITMHGCRTCTQRASAALRQYGAWPITEENLFIQ